MLGVATRWRLGYRDAAMPDTPANQHPDALANANGCLGLPARIARHGCREAHPYFLGTPLIALTLGALGYIRTDITDALHHHLTVVL
jgi:hypothetical protein